MSLLKEFKEFAMKGNLVDMAIGVVIGAAFGTVTSSFIDGVFMPLVGLLFNVENFDKYTFTVGKATVQVGKFIGAVINFIIIAFVMFLVIKAMNALKKEEAAPAAPTPTETLLTEIRDLLKK
ncbi:MAG: large conductance mechanosensitive channel protein MscL [Chitinophagales bacterium]|nr:large conductance mechanosensitive channel protein MscL [Chitinophagales bacterium]MDW8419383.1 large conductance mechanosensitive channel protein MscL [Chitinophagales bacterium]